MCSAARGIVRNAKQKKAVPAKNSEAIFWRPRFTWPLRAGKRANANFACSEGFFLSGVPRHMAGWPFLRRLVCPVRRLFSASAAYARGILWHCLPCLSALCRGHSFLLLFHVQPTEGSSLFLRCSAALFPARGSCHLLLFRGLLHPLPVFPFCVVYARFSLIFCLFLPNFCLSNFFSLVAQAATGLYFLPKRK